LYEYLPAVFKHIQAQKMVVSLETFKELMEDFKANIEKIDLSGVKHGPFFLYVEGAENLILIGWKGRRNNNILVGKEDLHFLRYLIRNQYFVDKY